MHAARRFPPRRLLIAGGSALGMVFVIFLAAQVIIRITNKDGQVSEIRPAPGAKVEIVDTAKAPLVRPIQPEHIDTQAGTSDLQTAPAADKDRPFVVVRAAGQREEFKGIGGAFAALQAGDTIDIHGNGPFRVPDVQLTNGLTLRAARGYRPRLVLRKPEIGFHSVVVRGPLTVEGCDFVSPESAEMFRGGGGPCEFRACRCLCPGRNQFMALVEWDDGPSIRIRDCLIVNYGIRATTKEVELANNVICQSRDQVLSIGVGQTIRLSQNTIVAGMTGSGSVLWQEGSLSPPAPTTVEAVDNIFFTGGLVGIIGPAGLKVTDCLTWRGKNNLYVGTGDLLGWQHAEEPSKVSVLVKDFAAWEEFWGREEGSRSVERVAFQPAMLFYGPTEPAMAWLRQRSDAIHRQLGLRAKESGPRWELIGPGEAYVRALAAAGKPVPADQLRPEALEDGPFVLLRQGKPVRAYPALQQAAAAAQSGDTIEVRTDGPVAGCNIEEPAAAPRTLTLRAAPGYRPVLSSGINGDGGNLVTIEGLHFRNCGLRIGPGTPAGGLARLANCSLEGEGRVDAACRPAAKDGRLEVRHCFIPRGFCTARRDAGDTSLIAISNSFLGIVSGDLVDRELLVDLRESMLGVPGLVDSRAWMPCFGSSSVVTAQANFFDGGFLLSALRPWRGEGNVYALTWGWPLEQQLRAELKSPEEGSVEADPAVFDPRTWRLLPSSPGYRERPDGKDLGADVSQVAGMPKAGTPPIDGRDVPLPSSSTDHAPDPDRRAAEWVLSIGGAIQVRQQGKEIQDIQSVAELPRGALELFGVELTRNSQVTDAGLGLFKDSKHLASLKLGFTGVTDAGLAHLKDRTNLTGLDLQSVQLTDAGLAHLKNCRNLTYLFLTSPRVTDAGLVHLKDCKNLTTLLLCGTRVTDAGLQFLKGCTKLIDLDLSHTSVSDAGLPILANFPNLHRLALDNTRVSAKGFGSIKALFPDRGITWWERNRVAAEAVLALGGSLHIRPKGDKDERPIKELGELPAEYFQVTRVKLAGPAKMPEDLVGKLAALNDPGFDHLKSLALVDQPIQSQDCQTLGQLPQVADLTLVRTEVDDVGLEHFKNLKELRRLALHDCPISGRGLAHLKDLPNLTELRLSCLGLGDLGVMAVGQMKMLERLSLAGTSVGDDGLKHLRGLSNLKQLDLSQTKVSAAGLADLQKALPQCRIEFDPAAKPAQ